MKFLYYKITSIVLLSVAFWLVSLPLVTIGPALIALSETIRTVASDDLSELGALETFFRSVRRNLVSGLPLSAVLVLVPLGTIFYLQLALEGMSGYATLGTIIGIYLCFCCLFFSVRLASISVQHRSWGLSRSFEHAIDTTLDTLDVSVLSACLFAVVLVVSVLFPPLLLLLTPGFFVIFESVLYETIAGKEPSRYHEYLGTRA
ncbi:DUF624 domain-containing protein [Halobacteria archaeon AArc-m2/3/4]|uniref:DUF624 domain-containing protein n=1 Tax=Natronoglomus mannanivorans TaxID=2979990 RepID=A0ABT2QJF3_9EURY|nr:DUF624 domain-containing protein [Halobacteria archaeon AArc-m2/3/4]